MNASAIAKILTFNRNARAISGIEALNSSQSKNVRLTSGQPGACVIAIPTSVKKTIVLRTATVTARRPSEPAVTLPRIREPRFSFSGLLQDGCAAGLRDPLILETLQRTIVLQLRQGLVDA